MLSKIFYSIYHANLAFSTIEEAEIPTVIDKCYFPLLDLVETLHVKIGLELSGFTLEQIQHYRPQWISRFKQLCKANEMELIGSGYMQIIGPIVPYKVDIKNQKIGLETYQSILGITPKIAYINEQTFSKSMVDVYYEAGYEAIAMEWNNAFSIHPKWKKSYAYTPAIAKGISQNLPVLWTDSILFQQFQRTIHNEQTFDDYFNFFTNYIALKHKCIPIYSSDLEIFNYRPGRFETEANISTDEWQRTKEMLILLQKKGRFELPYIVLKTYLTQSNILSLTNSANPIIVKKQDKYALGRWAACGHDANYINTLCYNYLALLNKNSTPNQWKELLQFWGSDYRTHTTLKKWQSAIETLETKLGNSPVKILYTLENDVELTRPEHKIVFEKDGIKISFLENKGLALEAMYIRGVKQPFGTIKHGELSHIGYVADFFTGSSVIESSQTKKVSDLVLVSHYKFNKITPNTYTLSTTINMKSIATEYKCWTIDTLNQTLMLSIDLKLHSFIPGSIRLGTFTLLPQKASNELYYSCHNGGKSIEKYSLNTEINHHLSKSLLQSSSSGIGATEGKIVFTNSTHDFATLTIDQQKSSPLIMLQNNVTFNKHLTRVFFSVQELDDTLKKNDKKIERIISLQYTIAPS